MKRFVVLAMLLTLWTLVDRNLATSSPNPDRCREINKLVQGLDSKWAEVVCKSKTETRDRRPLEYGTEVLYREPSGINLFVMIGKGKFDRKSMKTTRYGRYTIVTATTTRYVIETESIGQLRFQSKLAGLVQRLPVYSRNP